MNKFKSVSLRGATYNLYRFGPKAILSQLHHDTWVCLKIRHPQFQQIRTSCSIIFHMLIYFSMNDFVGIPMVFPIFTPRVPETQGTLQGRFGIGSSRLLPRSTKMI